MRARRRYFLRSPDAFGNLIVSRAWGHHPRAAPLFEAAIAPVFVGLQGIMCWLADRAVLKGARHSKVPQTEEPPVAPSDVQASAIRRRPPPSPDQH